MVSLPYWRKYFARILTESLHRFRDVGYPPKQVIRNNGYFKVQTAIMR